TAPNYELTWDYTNGTTPEQVKYSLNNKASYNASAMTIVQNQTTRKLDMWYGPGIAGPIIRENSSSDTNPYRDVAQPIDCQYETSDFPGVEAPRGQVSQHHG